MNSIETSFAEKKLKGISISFLPVLKNLIENTQGYLKKKSIVVVIKKEFRYSF